MKNQADARETGAAATRRQRSRSPRGRERGPQCAAIPVLQAAIELLRAAGQPLQARAPRTAPGRRERDPAFILGISIHTFFWAAAPPGWEPFHCSPRQGGVPHAKMVCLEILRGGTVVWRGTQAYRGAAAVGRHTEEETLVQGEWVFQGGQMMHRLRALAALEDDVEIREPYRPSEVARHAEVWTRMSWVPSRLGIA